MTALFGFFVGLAISVKQKDSSQLKVRSTRYLGAQLTNDSAALQLKARGRATLNSTGNELSAFWFSILESRAITKTLSSFILAVAFEREFQADLG